MKSLKYIFFQIFCINTLAKLNYTFNFSFNKNKIIFIAFMVFKKYLRGLIYSNYINFLLDSIISNKVQSLNK